MSRYATCSYCGLFIGTKIQYVSGKLITLLEHWDHWYPVSKGGEGSDTILACHMCNLRKTNKIFDSLVEAREYLRECWRNSTEEIEFYSSPLLDHSELIKNLPIRTKTYEETIRVHNLPTLQERENHATPKGEVLFDLMQSASISRARETEKRTDELSIRRKILDEQPEVISKETLVELEDYAETWPANQLLPYRELYKKYSPSDIELLIRLRLAHIKRLRDEDIITGRSSLNQVFRGFEINC